VGEIKPEQALAAAVNAGAAGRIAETHHFLGQSALVE